MQSSKDRRASWSETLTQGVRQFLRPTEQYMISVWPELDDAVWRIGDASIEVSRPTRVTGDVLLLEKEINDMVLHEQQTHHPHEDTTEAEEAPAESSREESVGGANSDPVSTKRERSRRYSYVPIVRRPSLTGTRPSTQQPLPAIAVNNPISPSSSTVDRTELLSSRAAEVRATIQEVATPPYSAWPADSQSPPPSLALNPEAVLLQMGETTMNTLSNGRNAVSGRIDEAHPLSESSSDSSNEKLHAVASVSEEHKPHHHHADSSPRYEESLHRNVLENLQTLAMRTQSDRFEAEHSTHSAPGLSRASTNSAPPLNYQLSDSALSPDAIMKMAENATKHRNSTSQTSESGVLVSCHWQLDRLLPIPAIWHASRTTLFRIMSVIWVWGWLIIVGFAGISNPPLFAIIALLTLMFVASGFVNCDSRLAWILCFTWEWFFVTANSVIFTGVAVWSLWPAYDVVFWLSYPILAMIFHSFILFTDAASVQIAPHIRIFLIASGAAYLIHIFFLDVMGLSRFEDHDICFVFCTGTRRLVSFCGASVLSFALKYLAKTIYNLYKKRQRFVLLSFPIYIRAMRISQPETPLEDEITVIHVSTRIPDRYIRNHNVADRFRPRPSHMADVPEMHRSFAFSPALPLLFAISITRKRWYTPTLIASIIFFCTFAAFINDYEAVGLGIPAHVLLYIALFFVFFFETTRFDRTLLHCVVIRYEFWLLMVSGSLYVIFGIFALSPTGLTAADVSSFLIWALLCLTLGVFDAAPSYPRYLKAAGFIAMIANSVRVYVRELYFTPQYAQTRVCLFFCADARSFALSGLLTVTLYSLRYLYLTIRRPGQCVMLRTRIGFKVQRIKHDGATSPRGIALRNTITFHTNSRQLSSTPPVFVRNLSGNAANISGVSLPPGFTHMPSSSPPSLLHKTSTSKSSVNGNSTIPLDVFAPSPRTAHLHPPDLSRPSTARTATTPR